MKICPNKHTMPNGENFPDMFTACPICAATLVEELQNIQLVCKNCGLSLESDWNICPACGTSVNGKVSQHLDKESEIPSDILQLLERRHKLRELNLYPDGAFEEVEKIDTELQKNKLEYYIELDAKSPNAELEDYIGDHCNKREEKYRWWIKSADNGCIEDYGLAFIAYRDGIGRKANQEKAWNYLEKGVDAGDYGCISIMAGALYDENDKDELEKLKELIEKLINANADRLKATGYGMAGQIEEDNSEYARAFNMYKNSFKLGSIYAGFKLSLSYKDGLGIEADSKKSITLMKKVAKGYNKKYSGEACRYLGQWYENGDNGCEKDQKKAFEYYEKGAEIGSESCKYNLGLCYYSGFGVDFDKEYGKQLIKEAADGGDEDAQKWLTENT